MSKKTPIVWWSKNVIAHGVVFEGLEGDALAEFVYESAIQSPGFSQWCRHHQISSSKRWCGRGRQRATTGSWEMSAAEAGTIRVCVNRNRKSFPSRKTCCVPIEPVKIVLGGRSCWVEMSEPTQPKTRCACGWIGWKETQRKRKNRDPWVCRQAWLYWEESGGKKRSRYIPKDKFAMVEESVYGLRRPIGETLELFGKW